MMSNYYLTGSWFWSLHWLFGTMFLVGVVLLIIWMTKNLDKKQFLRWMLILLIVGALGGLLTMGGGTRGWNKMMDWDRFDVPTDIGVK